MRGVRPAWLGIGFAWIGAAEAASDPADLQARGKTFEIALLLVGKVDWERFDFHGVRRSSCGHHRWLQRDRECDRAEIDTAVTAAQFPRKRSDQPRCCGNPSWT